MEEAQDPPRSKMEFLDSDKFYELKSEKTFTKHRLLQSGSASNIRYSIGTHSGLSRSKPSIVVYSGDDKTGEVLGVVKLRRKRVDMGLGDPQALMTEGDQANRVIWEQLFPRSKWLHDTYEFEYGNNTEEGERSWFTWRKVNGANGWKMQDLNLRAGKKEKTGGELLAVWKRDKMFNPKNGSLFIKRRHPEAGNEGIASDETQKWEMIVVLSYLAITEANERRRGGHDDVFAILLAACHPSLDLLGISTVHGNSSLAHTTANAGSILTAIGRTDVPVYPGAAKPFCRTAVYAPQYHGESGLDGTDLLPPATVPPITKINAIVAMHAAIMTRPPATVSMVATGALTNVALLFATFPETAAHMKSLSIMGGAISNGFTSAPLKNPDGTPRVGNFTPWAEFNIFCDPEAAVSVFSNQVLAAKTTLIPLDITHLVLATPTVQQMILYGSETPDSTAAKPSSLRQMFHDLLMYFAHTYATVAGIKEGPPLHDPIAVAVILDDIGAENIGFDDHGGERWFVDVVTAGKHSTEEADRGQMGRTMVKPIPTGGSGVRIPRDLNVEKFWAVLGECISRADMKKAPV